jgi:ABC-type amino acid transport substrate-binding protein
MGGKVRGLSDLPTARVGTVAQSAAQSYLDERGLAGVVVFDTEQDGLQSLVDGKIDAFVFDASIVRYLEKTQFRGLIAVLPKTFDEHFMSIAVPRGSAMREPLNRAILKIMESDDWTKITARY